MPGRCFDINNLIRGRLTGQEEMKEALSMLPAMLQADLEAREITPEMVIGAADKLSRSMRKEELAAALAATGMEYETAAGLVEQAITELGRPSLLKKLERELGNDPFTPVEVEKGVWEQYQPLGVLTHIAAGNAAGLPAMSVLEGLLAGNINLLKLPGGDEGISTLLLFMLVEAEPRLAPYIYVFDLPSHDVESIKALSNVSDGVAVWGSDAAVSGIRAITPPGTAIIEWGHKLSFGYVTKSGESEEALHGLATDICSTEQLLCSSPQCVYYETDDRYALLDFAQRFAKIMAQVSSRYPHARIDIHSQSEITAAVELARMEEVLGEKAVIRDSEYNWSVLVDYESGVKPSPLFRNVWIMPIKRENILDILRPNIGHLQTAGLACGDEEYEEIACLFFKSGVNRITLCGEMSRGYMGEPHDGAYALRRYVRRVSFRR
ncbi:MAG: acyl-CoA reductase [Bacillota bacterium]|nr:acyl-CoA reductase [Bacillota bacterium]